MTTFPHETGSETIALLALRRSLWQLALAGVMAGAALARFDPGAPMAAAWCAALPLVALAVHYRGVAARLLARLERTAATRPLPQPAQARRLRPARTPGPRRRRARTSLRRAMAAAGWFVSP